jgi:hypothetical protein
MVLLPQGTYVVRARTWTYCRSDKGNWYLKVTFAVTSGEHADQTVPGIFNFATERQCRDSYAAMQAMGWGGGDPIECHDNGGDLDRNTVEAVVQHREYGGRMFATVERIVSAEDADAHRLLREFLESRVVAPPAKTAPAQGGIERADNV